MRPGQVEKFPALISASQVDLTGKPAAAWKYWTRDPTLGGSWALRAAGGVGAEGWMEETGLSSGRIEKRQSFAPVVSLYPLSRMSLLLLEKTVTALLSNRTLQP